VLRIVTGVAVSSVLLGSLGCSSGGGAAPEDPPTTPSVGDQSPALSKPVVAKKYFEDLIGDPASNNDYEEYRYWDYTFDFGDREYLARVYTDEPESAYVDRIDEASVENAAADYADVDLDGDVGVVQRREIVERANLRVVLRYLRQDGWPQIMIQTQVGDLGYKPLALR
jgi:hypothetical protein